MVLMSVELILNAVNLNFIAFALMHGNIDGSDLRPVRHRGGRGPRSASVSGSCCSCTANRRSISLDELSEMKG
jgi:hypothetical protein